MARLVLITGASAGIGAAFAEAYAARGWDLALTARRTDRLEALAARLAHEHGVQTYPLPADLADPQTPARLASEIALRGRDVDALVNNAGYGLRGGFPGQTARDQRMMLEVLLVGPTALTREVLPGMRGRGYGRILNVASVLGRVPGSPNSVLYSAAKAFVVSFSEGLHLENRDAGVHVTALCPGLTRSEFHEVAGITEEIAAAPRWTWMTARAVAEAGIEAVEANRALCTPGAVNKALTGAAKLLPEDWALALMDWAMRRARKRAM